MGFLDKLFDKEQIIKPVNKTRGASGKGNRAALYAFYTKKYTEMLKQGQHVRPNYEVAKCEGCDYPWATSCEEEKMCRRENQAVRGDAVSIAQLICCYAEGVMESVNDDDYTIFQDDDKVQYWKDYLMKGAAEGNRSYQAALVTTGYPRGTKLWKSAEEISEWKEKYANALIEDARNGVPEAQYAIAQFMLDGAELGSEKRRQYLRAAGEAGIGDAYFVYAKDFELDKFIREGESIKYGSPDSIEYYKFIRQCADSHSGAFCGYAQELIGGLYADGDCGYPRDTKQAIHYYQLAVNNGYLSAKASLDYLMANAR